MFVSLKTWDDGWKALPLFLPFNNHTIMKIGFDGKRAVQNHTGLGNYSRYVMEALCLRAPQNEYVLFAPRQQVNTRLEALQKRFAQLITVFPDTWIGRKLSAWWRVWGVTSQLSREEVDVFHGLSNELPLNISSGNIPSVVTMHDLIFLRHPELYGRADQAICAFKARQACQKADVIIAISECTKRDIMHYYGTDPTKIEVVYQGCDPVFGEIPSPEALADVRCRYDLPARFVLNVGSIEKRKNVLLVVKSLSSLPEEAHLVIVGKHTPYTDEVVAYAATHGLSHRVRILHNVPFGDLPAFYRCAEVFVYPSRYEGFGIPILEALESEVPVVAATGSCLEEAGGPDSCYVHPDDVEGMGQILSRLLSCPEERRRMAQAGKIYARRFRADEHAERLLAVYERIKNINAF